MHIKKNIVFTNLLQNTKELKLAIPWEQIELKRDPLLYASAKINNFKLWADLSYLMDGDNSIPMYGFSITSEPIKLQVLPGVEEETETIIECGFFKHQKLGLKYLVKMKNLFRNLDF
jgi:hypothetical protein